MGHWRGQERQDHHCAVLIEAKVSERNTLLSRFVGPYGPRKQDVEEKWQIFAVRTLVHSTVIQET